MNSAIRDVKVFLDTVKNVGNEGDKIIASMLENIKRKHVGTWRFPCLVAVSTSLCVKSNLQQLRERVRHSLKALRGIFR